MCLHIAGMRLHIAGMCLHFAGMRLHIAGMRLHTAGVCRAAGCRCISLGLRCDAPTHCRGAPTHCRDAPTHCRDAPTQGCAYTGVRCDCASAACRALACYVGRASGGASSRDSAAFCVSVCCSSSIHGFVRYLNMSGRCLARIARFMRYRSRHCVLCLSNLSAASPIDSSVSCHRPLTSIAPKGGLPRGALCFVMAFL